MTYLAAKTCFTYTGGTDEDELNGWHRRWRRWRRWLIRRNPNKSKHPALNLKNFRAESFAQPTVVLIVNSSESANNGLDKVLTRREVFGLSSNGVLAIIAIIVDLLPLR